MGINYSPSIVRDGLVLHLDAANVKSYGDTTENLFSYSQDLANAVWTKNSSSVSVDAILAPDGTVTAEKLIVNNTLTAGNVTRNAGGLSATTKYTQSVYLKAGEWNYAFVWLNDGSGYGHVVEINLTTGAYRNTYTNASGRYTDFSYNVTTSADGWHRAEMSATTASALNFQMRVYPSNVAWTSGSFGSEYPAGNGTSGIYLWGFQIEQSPTANEYHANLGVSVKYRGTVWTDLSGNGRNFNWVSTPSFGTDSGVPYFTTLGNRCTGPASNSFGINNTSGYTIFLMVKQLSLVSTGSFKFYKNNLSGASGRGIFAHSTYSDNIIYFDQGGCCNTDTRTSVSSGGIAEWTILAFRRLTDSSTRSIIKNGVVLTTNTNSAASIDLDSRSVDLGSTDEYGGNSSTWNARLSSCVVYNRGLADAEIQQNFNALRGRYGI
jgi:hypothetical protein